MQNSLDNGGSNVNITRADNKPDKVTLQTNNQNMGNSRKTGSSSSSGDKPIATSIAEEMRKQYPKKV